MALANKLKTILSETFSAPTVDSYVIKVPVHGSVILRQGGNYAGIDLSGANLSGLNLGGINFEGAKLINANLSGTNLSHANLSGAILTGANLTSAHLDNARLDNIVATGVSFATPPSGVDPIKLR
jgi:uncharacterized protein YjbI with pentapeptide repeats